MTESNNETNASSVEEVTKPDEGAKEEESKDDKGDSDKKEEKAVEVEGSTSEASKSEEKEDKKETSEPESSKVEIKEESKESEAQEVEVSVEEKTEVPTEEVKPKEEASKEDVNQEELPVTEKKEAEVPKGAPESVEDKSEQQQEEKPSGVKKTDSEEVPKAEVSGKSEAVEENLEVKCDQSSEHVAPEDPKGEDSTSSSEEEKEDKEEDVEEGKELDDDEIKTNPAYIPKGGRFYMHDMRSGEAEEGPEGQNEKKSRADGLWSHDLYDERRQAPKNSQELKHSYGHNIRTPNKEEPQNAQKRTDNKRGPPRPFKDSGHRRVQQTDRERIERPERNERSDNSERYERSDRNERTDRNERPDRSDRQERTDRNFAQRPYYQNQNNQYRQQQNGQPFRLRTFKRTVVSSNPSSQQTSQDKENGTRKIENEFNNLNVTKPLPKRGPRPPNNDRNRQPRPGPSNNVGQRRPYNGHDAQPAHPVNAIAHQPLPGQIPVSLVGAPMMAPPVTFVPIGVAQAPPVMAAPVPPQFLRPRQPTDTVYFDLNTHVQQPTLPPRERRRLKFVAPTK